MYANSSNTQYSNEQAHLIGALRQFANDEVVSDVAKSAGMKRPQMLRNKLLPEQPHQLTVSELVKITKASGNRCIVDGVLLELNCVTSVSLGDLANASKTTLTDRALDINANTAQLGALALDVKATKRVTERMRHETVRRASYVMAELAIFVHDVEQKFQAIPVLTVASDAMQAMPMPGLM
ncbi:regulatory CII family protein [Shewanella halifaxensis HAW-EB4]|uniref:Regulatory CII family protein n=1 Tax=Shewanella halifaxensis (strain HAW-EB4) TaxID=458817 RepID=B0TKS4_SHEHH|nr:phage regulatory CII family protein [Shewanella halifaxensis]ABZ75876.1 regulatory CII family protein [Shewanella halifaxensis HAW-EB4]